MKNYKKKVKKGLKFNIKEEKLLEVGDANVLSVKYWKF